MGLPPKVYTWLCGLFASKHFLIHLLTCRGELNTYLGLGSIIFGYDLGVIAGVLPAPDFQKVMGPRYQNPNLLGLITSIFGEFYVCSAPIQRI